MPTQIYKTKDGKKVPGVTTTISQLGWSKQPLMYWACSQGQKYPDLPTYEALNKERDAAADAGTVSHEMIDCDLKGNEFDSSKYSAEILSKAETGFLNYLEWKRGANLKVVASETPLVSEMYLYGGTIDCLAIIRDRLTLLDWKTSNAVYEDHLIQIAAYAVLWEENFIDQPIKGGFDLLRISKETGAFTHYHWDSLPECFKAFLHLRDLYNIKTTLKKLK